jgi:isoquinoline 1-oxidoreductase beta subunit
VSAPETSRRRFLVGSASLLGGVAFGVVACREAAAPTAAAPAPPQPVSLTPFVTIDADGITLITPRTEMGQGIASTQAYLIAEELDVDPLSCRISPGMPDKVYYNAAVADALAPVPEYDHSDEAEAVREKGQAAFRKGGLQVTGGSTSIPDMFHRLRETGALARDTLKRAAADVTGVPVGELRTEDGHVWTPDGRKLAYTELAAAAASLTPGPTPTLRTPDQWRYLGKAIPRTDMAAKSTGTLEFGIDVAFDDMLYATVKTHPAWGGTMLGYDAAEAEAMPGVHAVVPLDGGVGIVADRTWTAFSAMKTVRFDWGPGPYPKSTAEMWPVLEAAVGDPALLEGVMRDDGDVDAVLAEAGDAVLRAEYRAPYLAHAALEPMNAVVKVTDTRVDVWTGTQIPAFVQAHVATVLEVPAEIVFVHNRPMGGSFGRRLEDEAVKQAALVARAAKGRPVKMTWTREEDMTHDFPRPMQLGRMAGVVRDGKVAACDIVTVGQSPARSWLGRIAEAPPKPDVLVLAGAWDQPMRIPNYRVTGYAPEGLPPVTTHRAPGANANGFFHECFLDELLLAAGLDPLEGRLALCHHEASRGVLEAVATLSDLGWHRHRSEPRPRRGLRAVSRGAGRRGRGRHADRPRHPCGRRVRRCRRRYRARPEELRGPGHRRRRLGARPRDERGAHVRGPRSGPDQLPRLRVHAALPDAAHPIRRAGGQLQDPGDRRADRVAGGAGARERDLRGDRQAHPRAAARQTRRLRLTPRRDPCSP